MLKRCALIYLALCFAASTSLHADATTAYVSGSSGGLPNTDLTRVDLITGNLDAFPFISGTLGGISLESSTLGYVADNNNNFVYRVNLTTGDFSQVNQSPIGSGPFGIQLANSTTAYLVSENDDNVYRLDLRTGNFSLVTPTPLPAIFPSAIALEMTVKDPKIAYVVGFATNSNVVYKVDLTNGNISQITAIPGARLFGIALANNTTAYTTDFGNGLIYRVDLTNGSFFQVNATPIPGSEVSAIALSNNNTAYIADYSNNKIFRIDLTNGSFSNIAALNESGQSGIGLVLQVGTAGLHGNNLKFANYLNNNAPMFTMPLIALQSDVPLALEITAPTRNAFSTFAAQTTQLAFGQVVADHLGQKRWARAWQRGPTTAKAEITALPNRLIAAASDDSPIDAEPSPNSSKNCTNYSFWLSGVGEYTRVHKQRQTPAFQTGTGGFVLAIDSYWDDPMPLLGGGVAYARTHIHEDDGFGHANIDQGAVMFFAAWSYWDFYFDMALWGSYYHAKNVRVINLPGVIGGSAHSSTNGWQLTPHLEVGYDYKDDWFCIEPFTMFDWVANWEGGFQEHGAGLLNMGQHGRFCSLFRNEWGVRFNETLTYDWGQVTFREKGSYAYQKAFNTGTLTAFLVGSSGTIVLSTLNGAQNLGVIEFDTLLVPCNKKYPYGTIAYQGEFGSRYQSHQGTVTIGMDF